MQTDKYLYISFLDSNSIRGGGHIETESEIFEFEKLFGNLDVIYSDINIKNKILKKIKQNGLNKFFVKPFNIYLPIFGKRPSLDLINLSNYDSVIIADGRCLIPFLTSIFSSKKIYFKSHGSLAIYFFSFIRANIILFKYRPLNTILKSTYYIVLAFIFFFVEIYIYIFSEKIFMMRSKKFFDTNFFGKLYNYFFSHKTIYSFCPSINNLLLNKKFNFYNFKKRKNNLKLSILIVGNWSLINNLASLFDFLKRISYHSPIKIYLVGQISSSNKDLINNIFVNKPKIDIKLFGFKKDISNLKKISDFYVGCSRYGSGVPIKIIEIIKESEKYSYKPLLSEYCMNSLKGILPINSKYIYPKIGPINFENFI